MGHGSWFSFLSFYRDAEHYFSDTFVPGLLFGQEPVVLQHVAAGILVTLLLLIVSIVARRQLDAAGDQAVIPDPKPSVRNFLELGLEALWKQSNAIIGKENERYFPVIATLALFILFSNLIGLVPGFLPPTDNWNTTMACGGFVFLYYNYHGLRTNGFGHIAHIFNPAGLKWTWALAPLLAPIEIVSHVARPFTLGVRLATNMKADHAVLFAFLGLAPWIVVPQAFLALGLLVCFVQTLVFVLLTMIYIAMATADQHHDEAHAH